MSVWTPAFIEKNRDTTGSVGTKTTKGVILFVRVGCRDVATKHFVSDSSIKSIKYRMNNIDNRIRIFVNDCCSFDGFITGRHDGRRDGKVLKTGPEYCRRTRRLVLHKCQTGKLMAR